MTTSFAETFARRAAPPATAAQASSSPTYVGNNRLLLRTIFGHKMFVDSRDLSLTPHLALDGFWEMWITRIFLQTVKPGMRVIEVGTNVGYYSLLACQQIGPKGSLIGFEANHEMAKLVGDNLNINGFLGIAKVHCKAAYSEAATLSFGIYDGHVASSSLFVDLSTAAALGDTVRTVQVEAIPIDDVVPSGERIDFIKVDAEGSELHVLQGAQRVLRENPHIKLIVEHSPTLLANTHHGAPSALYNFATSLGFKVSRIDHDARLVPSSFSQLADAGHCDVLLERR